MSQHSLGSLGFASYPEIIDARPATTLVVEWFWQHPLRAILAVGGWSIDDVVSDPRIAAQVRLHWRIHCQIERLERERDRRRELEQDLEDLAWAIECRKQGLPVSCPWCSASGTCSCRWSGE